ncbi:MAG: hypothetical protein IJW71_03990 [Clostridia bacterium]|nr:hypothetical protein [Clostridia bacterium]
MKRVLILVLLFLLLSALFACGAPKGEVGTVNYYLQLDLSDYLRLKDRDLEGLTVTVPAELQVTDADLNRMIDSILLGYATRVDNDALNDYPDLLGHAITTGDSIAIYYYATDADGNMVDTFSNYYLPTVFRVGNSGFLPGFDDAIASLETYVWETRFEPIESGKISADDIVFVTYKITHPDKNGLATVTVADKIYGRVAVADGGVLAESLVGRYVGASYSFERIEDIDGDGETENVTYEITPNALVDEVMRTFSLTVPEGYCASLGLDEEQNYDGQTLTFHIAIDCYYIMPELTDAFLREKLKYNGGVAAFRAQTHADLLIENGGFSRITETAFSQLLSRVELRKFPKNSVDSYVSRLKYNIESNHRFFTTAYAYTNMQVTASLDAYFEGEHGFVWRYADLAAFLKDHPDKTQSDYDTYKKAYEDAQTFYRNYFDQQFEEDYGFKWVYENDLSAFAHDFFEISFKDGESLDAALRRTAEQNIKQDILFFALAEEFEISFTEKEITAGYDAYLASMCEQLDMTREECIAYYNDSFAEGYLADRALYELYNQAIAKKLYPLVNVTYQ